jgi:glyoxylase I family protein
MLPDLLHVGLPGSRTCGYDAAMPRCRDAAMPRCRDAAMLRCCDAARLRGSINHLDLTVSDLSVSEPFYDLVLGYLGFERLEPPPGTTSDRPTWHAKEPAQRLFSIALCQARPGSRPHDRFTPGLHHLAFHAESRADLDGLYRFLHERGVTILDPPATSHPRGG